MFIYKDRISKDIISLLTDMRVFYILTNQTWNREAELTDMYNTLKNHSVSNGLIGDSKDLKSVLEYGYLGIDIGENKVYTEVEISWFDGVGLRISGYVNVTVTKEGGNEFIEGISLKDLPCYDLIDKLYREYIVF